MSETAPIYGNYRGYYAKRPAVHDRRLQLLPLDFFRGARVLDVGCNEGWVTCEIAQAYGARYVIGVDIDDTLVRAAWRRRRSVWSQYAQNPAIQDDQEQCSNVRYTNADADSSKTRPKKKIKLSAHTNSSKQQTNKSRPFPVAFEHMFGPLTMPPLDARLTEARYPHNIVFRTADWVQDGVLEDEKGYDIVLGLSITKWIHLNSGDEGLKRFFLRVFNALRPGGVFVLEPQDWDSYAKAKRLDPKLRENAKKLVSRPSDFENILCEEIGFSSVQHLGTSGKGGFHRPLDLYFKAQG